MKKKFFKYKKRNIDRIDLGGIINYIIDLKLFRPSCYLILGLFFAFKIYHYTSYYTNSRNYQKIIHKNEEKIKINNSGIQISKEYKIDHKVKSGETILGILSNIGLDEVDSLKVVNSIRKVHDPRLISQNDNISIQYVVKIKITEDGGYNKKEKEVRLKKLVIYPDPETRLIVNKNTSNEYITKKEKVKLTKNIIRYSGILRNSLFIDGMKVGISPKSMMKMIELYSYDVDFQRDIKSGNKFEMIIEGYFNEDGKKIRDGEVLYSSLKLNDRLIELYMFEVGGVKEYFNGNGFSIKKALLRTPINGARISSSFGYRKHPVLGYKKLHRGVDFAAPTGTPILAAGNGTIQYMARFGSYGNYVRIRHNKQYSTAYAHASRFARGLKKGSVVKQGQVIAYVGTTGRSTGPHLHFELLKDNERINPSKVKAMSGLKLYGKDLKKFNIFKSTIDRYRKNLPSNPQ